MGCSWKLPAGPSGKDAGPSEEAYAIRYGEAMCDVLPTWEVGQLLGGN